jgi:hypothetical protein
MTATHVQRTLVKSAPEIWAELSDPEALARHLDDVGEIRITRAQPEEKIEWETEGARGSVLIKPSGWGTRVTLTMSREQDPAPSAAGAEASLDAAAEALVEPQAEIAPKPQQQTVTPPEPDTVEPRLPDAAAQSEPQASAAQSEPQASAAQSEPDASAAQPEPETFEPEYEPLEAELPLSTPVDAARELEPPAEPELDQDTPSHRPDLLPRRGFLARLLRRRGRRGAQAASSGTGAAVHGLAAPVQGIAVREPSPWPTASSEWVEQFPIRQPDTEIAPSVAEPETTPEDMPGDTETPPDEPIAGAGMPGDPETPADGPIAGADMPGDTETQADAPVPGAEGMTIGDEPHSPAPPAQAHVEQVPAPAGDDTAVLSAVLDRLGAAHHRPFSRG